MAKVILKNLEKVYNEPANKFVAGFIGSPAMNMMEVNLILENNEIYIQDNNFKLRLPKNKAEKVKSYVGKKVWFGIRPEHIYLANEENNVENCIKVKIDVVEQMGNEVFVYFSRNLNQYIARMNSKEIINAGNEYELFFDMTQFHIFDKETEKNISL